MQITTVAEPVGRRAPGAYDRAFYTSMSVVMAVTVFAGFARTYYLRGWAGSATTFSGVTTLTPLLEAHGALFSAWVLLFIAQTALVAGRRVSLHRKLGVAGVALAAAMIVAGIKVAIAAAARGSAPPGIDPLAFLVVPLFDIALFAGFVTAAVGMRRNNEAHKRLMLLAYVSIITAAVARLPGIMVMGPPVFFGLSFLFVVAGIVYDKVSRGRVHPVYVWGGGLLFLSVPLRLAISGTSAWRAFAGVLVG